MGSTIHQAITAPITVISERGSVAELPSQGLTHLCHLLTVLVLRRRGRRTILSQHPRGLSKRGAHLQYPTPPSSASLPLMCRPVGDGRDSPVGAARLRARPAGRSSPRHPPTRRSAASARRPAPCGRRSPAAPNRRGARTGVDHATALQPRLDRQRTHHNESCPAFHHDGERPPACLQPGAPLRDVCEVQIGEGAQQHLAMDSIGSSGPFLSRPASSSRSPRSTSGAYVASPGCRALGECILASPGHS